LRQEAANVGYAAGVLDAYAIVLEQHGGDWSGLATLERLRRLLGDGHT
jgi:hypothetical protein